MTIELTAHEQLRVDDAKALLAKCSNFFQTDESDIDWGVAYGLLEEAAVFAQRVLDDLSHPELNSQANRVRDRVLALWDRPGSQGGWIPGALYAELAEALDVPPERLLQQRATRVLDAPPEGSR